MDPVDTAPEAPRPQTPRQQIETHLLRIQRLLPVDTRVFLVVHRPGAAHPEILGNADQVELPALLSQVPALPRAHR